MNFPNLPGVPPLKGYSGIAAATTLAAPLVNLLLNMLKPAWGIYDEAGTKQVLFPDNFVGLDYRNDNHIADYPIERGAFSSYDKVRTPFSVKVKVSKGSTVGDTQKKDAFLKDIEYLASSLHLYTIITPDFTYFRVNLEEYDYRREVNNGSGIIIADLHFVEVLQAAVLVPASNTTVLPNSAATAASATPFVNNGPVQAGNPLSALTTVRIL